MAAQFFHNWLNQTQGHIGICSGIIRNLVYGHLGHTDRLDARAYELRNGGHHMSKALEYLVKRDSGKDSGSKESDSKKDSKPKTESASKSADKK